MTHFEKLQELTKRDLIGAFRFGHLSDGWMLKVSRGENGTIETRGHQTLEEASHALLKILVEEARAILIIVAP